MLKLEPLRSFNINVNLILNDEDKSIISFTSVVPSTLSSFIHRLKLVGEHVIPTLKQQDGHRTLLVTPSLFFGNYSNTLKRVYLKDFYLKSALDKLMIATNEIDGGNFELEIGHPNSYLGGNLFTTPGIYEDESNYNSDESG